MTCARARGLGVPRRRTTTGAPFPQPLRHPSPAACFSNLLCFCFCVGDLGIMRPAFLSNFPLSHSQPSPPTPTPLGRSFELVYPLRFTVGPVEPSAGGFLNRFLVALLWSRYCTSLSLELTICKMRFTSTSHNCSNTYFTHCSKNRMR